MTIEVALLISGVSLAFGIYQGVTNMQRAQKADNRADATELTTVLVKLDNISIGIADLKAELKHNKDETREIRDKVIVMEQSLNTVWKYVDELRKGGQGQ